MNHERHVWSEGCPSPPAVGAGVLVLRHRAEFNLTCVWLGSHSRVKEEVHSSTFTSELAALQLNIVANITKEIKILLDSDPRDQLFSMDSAHRPCFHNLPPHCESCEPSRQLWKSPQAAIWSVRDCRTAKIWLKIELESQHGEALRLRSTPSPPSIFHQSATREPPAQPCPHWPLWSLAKWRLPLPDQTQHLLFTGQLAIFPVSWGQSPSRFRMFCPFFRPAMMPTVPGRPPKLHQSGGLNRFHPFFCRKGDGWV